MVETAATSELLRCIVLLPLIGAVVHGVMLGLVRRELPRGLVIAISCLAPALAFLVTLVAFFQLRDLPAGQTALVDGVYTWIGAGRLVAEMSFLFDPLSAVMCLIVTGVGTLIHVYSIGYMDDDHRDDGGFQRFFCYLNLFLAAMLLLVLGDNLLVMFLGWEGVGLCSYLLIGFWFGDRWNAYCGMKAFVVNRIGDFGFLIGIFLILWALADAGGATLDFREIQAAMPAIVERTVAVPTWLGGEWRLTTLIGLCLFVGAVGKSAQIPLYVWLPDAMAGPTPVSALIHAATMVTAGIYMVCRMSFLYAEAPGASAVIAWTGAITALFAATMAIAQTDIKKVLAYSTVSQLGYMFLAAGCGAYSAAIFHVGTHAFFKALLFLCAGSVMHALHGELDVFKMGGLRRIMPVTALTFLVAALAISGVFPFAAFFSKDLILEQAFERGHIVVWALGVVAAGLTAFYTFRAFFLAFTGSSRLDPHVAKHAHESPGVMTIPLVVLAVLSFVGGWVGLPHGWLWGNSFVHYLEPSLAILPETHHGGPHVSPTALMLLTSAVAFAGIGVAWLLYGGGSTLASRLAASLGAVYRALWNKWYVDEIYDALVVRPYVSLARFFWKVVDSLMIDGLVNGVGRLVVATAQGAKSLQSGLAQSYLVLMVIGAVGLLVALVRGI